MLGHRHGRYAKMQKRLHGFQAGRTGRSINVSETASVRIPLTRGKFAIVDAEDAARVRAHNWCAVSSGNGFYAGRGEYNSQSLKSKSILMHRFIMGAGIGQEIDHINGDRMDNRKRNLRFCTRAQNAANAAAHRDSTSSYKGVSWNKKDRRWVAHLRNKHLGNFKAEKSAAIAYDAKAREAYGEFARLNFKEAA